MTILEPAEQLERLLAEPPASAAERARTSFDRAAAPFERSVVLFGAGGLGRKTLAGLRKAGIEPLALSDNNPALWGKTIDGVRVWPPAEAAAEFGRRAAFVVTIWWAGGRHRFEHSRTQLHALGCTRVISFGLLFWKYPELFLPYYAMGLPQAVLEQAGAVRQAFEIWGDEFSRNVFVAQVRWRLRLDFDGLPPAIAGDQYFPDDLFSLSPREVFVDCGAFDGDTIRTFVERRGSDFDRIIAFEPDPISFAKLTAACAAFDLDVQSKISISQAAAGSGAGTLRFNATGLAESACGTGNTEVRCVALDDALANFAPTYIKMDIEGAEPAALRGARSVIRDHGPILAISVYHEQDHLWRIPLWMHQELPGHLCFLRPHREDCWDLVLYAVPPARLSSESNIGCGVARPGLEAR